MSRLGHATSSVTPRNRGGSLPPWSTAEFSDLIDACYLKPEYQPIFDLVTGEQVAAEPLARWPALGVTPDVAFWWAAESGRLAELDEACRNAAIVDAIAGSHSTTSVPCPAPWPCCRSSVLTWSNSMSRSCSAAGYRSGRHPHRRRRLCRTHRGHGAGRGYRVRSPPSPGPCARRHTGPGVVPGVARPTRGGGRVVRTAASPPTPQRHADELLRLRRQRGGQGRLQRAAVGHVPRPRAQGHGPGDGPGGAGGHAGGVPLHPRYGAPVPPARGPLPPGRRPGHGDGTDACPRVRGVALGEDDPLRHGWVVAVVGAHYAGALIAHDLGDEGADRDRRFAFVLTHDSERCWPRPGATGPGDQSERRFGSGRSARPSGGTVTPERTSCCGTDPRFLHPKPNGRCVPLAGRGGPARVTRIHFHVVPLPQLDLRTRGRRLVQRLGKRCTISRRPLTARVARRRGGDFMSILLLCIHATIPNRDPR